MRLMVGHEVNHLFLLIFLLSAISEAAFCGSVKPLGRTKDLHALANFQN